MSKKIRSKTGEITVKTNKGDHKVQAKIYNDLFAVHEIVTDYKKQRRCYTVTHLPTGLAAMPLGSTSKQQAIDLVKFYLTDPDRWLLEDYDEIRRGFTGDFVQKVKEIIQ